MTKTSANHHQVLVREILIDVLRRRAEGELLSDEEVLKLHQDLGPELRYGLEQLAVIRDAADEVQVVEMLGGILDRTLGVSAAGESFDNRAGPQFIGKYRVLQVLGHGGQADVFRVENPDIPDLPLVIKWARCESAGSERSRLVEEGQVLAGLDDPGLLRIYDVGFHDDRAFIVMDFVPGVAFRSARRCPPRRAAELVAEAAEILDRVHRKGVLHRDIKPGNLMLDDNANVRVMDFGLAWTVPWWRAEEAFHGDVSGTFAYMAPEQARGDTSQIGPWTDVFGLGAVLYDLLTGRPPYAESTVAVVWGLARECKYPPLRQLRPGVPAALERICRKAMAADVADRYQSACDLGAALHHYLLRGRWMAIISLIGFVALLFGGTAYFVRTLVPTTSVQLDGDLILRVWSEDKRGLPVDDPAALPVRNGELVHLYAKLNQPAYLYLLWIDSEGKVLVLPPGAEPTDDLGALLRRSRPAHELHHPKEFNRGWPVTGPSGLETVVLLARNEPLRDNTELASLFNGLPAMAYSSPREAVWIDDASGAIAIRNSQHRGISKEPHKIDDAILDLLERLRHHFELIRAIQFAHEGH